MVLSCQAGKKYKKTPQMEQTTFKISLLLVVELIDNV